MGRLAKGQALAAHGDFEPALEALAKARDGYERELRTNYHAEYACDGLREASQLFDLVYGKLHSGEQVVVEHGTRGKLDRRTTDYEAFADHGDARTEGDQRSLRALWGVAGSGLALVRIDALCTLEGHPSWVFKHAFGHLGQRCFALGLRGRITELFERAVTAGT